MSFEAAAWAIKAKTETATEKLVLILITDCISTETGIGWPSVDYLSEHAMCSVRTVQRSIRSLEKQGMLSVEVKPGRANIYRVPTSVNVPQRISRSINDSDPRQSDRGDMGVRGGCHPCQGGVTRESPQAAPALAKSAEPIINQSLTNNNINTFVPSDATKTRMKLSGITYTDEILNHYQTYLEDKIEQGVKVNPQSGFITWCRNARNWAVMDEAQGKKKAKKQNLFDMTDSELMKLCKVHKIATHGKTTKQIVEKLRVAM